MKRVIPRDLFNDANLLKCYGQLYLELERLSTPYVQLLDIAEGADTKSFMVQDNADGETWLANVHLYVLGQEMELYRPMNSRDNYPLYMRTASGDIDVFDEAGKLTQKFVIFLKGELV